MKARCLPCLIAILLLSTLWPAPALAQQPKAGVVTAVQGQATLKRPVLPQPLPVKFKDDVFLRDQINTQESAIVRVLLGGKALVTVRELSVFTVTEEPGKAVLDLQSGRVAVAVARSRMKPGESIEIRTQNAVAAARGSVGVITTGERDGKPETEVAVLDGVFRVAHRGSHIPPMDVGANFIASIFGRDFNPLQQMTDAQRNAYRRDTRGPRSADRAAAGDNARDNQMDTAADLSNRLNQQSEGCPPNCSSTPPPPPPPTLANHLCVNCRDTTEGSTGNGNSTGTSTLITFDPVFPNLPSGVTLQYFNGGMTGVLSALPGPNATSLTSSASAISGGGNALLLLDEGFGPFGALITFSALQKIVSAIGNDFGGDPTLDNEIVHLTAFDSSGNVIGSSTFQASFATPNITPVSFTSSAKNIKFAAFTWENDLGFYQVDNIEFVDPPFFPQFVGASFSTTSTAPLTELISSVINTGTDLVLLDQNSSLSLGGPLLSDIGSTFSVASRFVAVRNGSRLVSTSPDPLIRLSGSAVTTGLDFIGLSGSATAVDSETGLLLGTDKPLQINGTFLETSGATVSAQRAAQVDTALLEASAPLLNLTAGSTLTTSQDAFDLSYRAKVASLGPLVRLDGSTLNVLNGALINVAGGSYLGVSGDLIRLSNGSTLNLLNGSLLSVSGGSVLNVSGALLAFSGTGGNTVNVANSLCPCTLFSGVPVALTNGAVASNVSIGATPIRNSNLGSVNLSSNAALVVVSGSTSKVTIAGN